MSTQYSAEMSADLAHTVMLILHDWGVEPSDQVTLLGLPSGTKPRALTRYRQGTALPEDADTGERIAHLVAIHQGLSVMFSYNPQLANLWVTTGSDRFGGASPLDVMLGSGIDGMRRVRDHMDGGFEW